MFFKKFIEAKFGNDLLYTIQTLIYYPTNDKIACTGFHLDGAEWPETFYWFAFNFPL